MPFLFLRFLVGQALFGLAVLLPFVTLFYLLARKKSCRGSHKSSILHLLAVYAFCFSLLVVFDITGMPDITQFGLGRSTINLVPFDVFRTNYMQYYQNILLFVPFGFLLPLCWQRFQNALRAVAAGLALSLFIETVQLFTHRAADVDDLMMNTLGAAAGYLIFACIRRLFPRLSAFSAAHEGLWRWEAVFCAAAAWAVILLAQPVALRP